MPKSTIAPLCCRRCDREGQTYTLRVERGQHRRRRDGRRRLSVNVTCTNGHEWFSVHPQAIKRSREADLAAKRRADGAE